MKFTHHEISNKFSLSFSVRTSYRKISKIFLILIIILINISGYSQYISKDYLILLEKVKCLNFNKENHIQIMNDENENEEDNENEKENQNMFPIKNKNIANFIQNQISNILDIKINKLLLPGLIVDKLEFFDFNSLVCSYNYGIRLFEIINLDKLKPSKKKEIKQNNLPDIVKNNPIMLKIVAIFEDSIKILNEYRNDFIILKFTSHSNEIIDYLEILTESSLSKYVYSHKNLNIKPNYGEAFGKIILILDFNPPTCFSFSCKNNFPKETKRSEYFYKYIKNEFNTFVSGFAFFRKKTIELFSKNNEIDYKKLSKFNDFIYDYNFSLKTHNKNSKIPRIVILKKFIIKEVYSIVEDLIKYTNDKVKAEAKIIHLEKKNEKMQANNNSLIIDKSHGELINNYIDGKKRKLKLRKRRYSLFNKARKTNRDYIL